LLKDGVRHRSKELSPKILSDLILLSTMGKSDHDDLFSTLEPDIILKLKSMSLDDLINIMWAAGEVNRGGPLLYETLETELSKRLRAIRDDQFETLISCFSGDKATVNNFSRRFLKLVLHVIKEKRDRFSLKSIV
jgi:hypothetical protein